MVNRAVAKALVAPCLAVVVLTHVAEALHLFPWMHWGQEHSVGHYLGSAVLASPSFPWDTCFMRLKSGTSNVQA